MDTCSECVDGTRDIGTNCECNNGFYSLVGNISCTERCDYKYEVCQDKTGSLIECSDTNRD